MATVTGGAACHAARAAGAWDSRAALTARGCPPSVPAVYPPMARFGLPATLILLALVTGCATIPGEGVVRLGEGIDDRWIVRWNDALGTPSLMTNLALQDVYVAPDTPAVDDSTARAAVTRVVARESASFRIRPGVDDLVPVSSRVSRWIRIVRLQQVYRGVPVLGAGYDAHVFPNGRVGTIEGRFQPDLHLQVAPLVGPRQAEERARARAPGEVPPALRYDL